MPGHTRASATATAAAGAHVACVFVAVEVDKQVEHEGGLHDEVVKARHRDLHARATVMMTLTKLKRARTSICVSDCTPAGTAAVAEAAAAGVAAAAAAAAAGAGKALAGTDAITLRYIR